VLGSCSVSYDISGLCVIIVRVRRQVSQCVAVAACCSCSVLQCVAVFHMIHEGSLQSSYECAGRFRSVLKLQRVAVSCSVLQCNTVRCSVLQCVVVCCSALQCGVAVCYRVLLVEVFFNAAVCCMQQCVVVCCSVLQRVAVCRSVSQCVPVFCSVLLAELFLDVVACCSVLHRGWKHSASMQRCGVVCCSVLQRLQCVAMCCSGVGRALSPAAYRRGMP